METKFQYLSPPKVCNCCNSSNVEFISNEKIYGESKGVWPFVYYCNDCFAYVGCHSNTIYPLGFLANRKIRLLRLDAHKVFDNLWKTGVMSRIDAYKWLSEKLEIAFENCHISWLNENQLLQVIEVSNKFSKEELQTFLRRKRKNYDAERKRIDRDERKRKLEISRSKQGNKSGRRFRISRGRKGD